jgi:hypothetical protein
MDYEKDTDIDEQALDVEWLQQAHLMRKYTKYASMKKKEMDEAKERLDFGKAQLQREIRNQPSDFGIAKVTEAGIESTVLLQPEYRELKQEYTKAQYEYDVAMGAVRAIDQKKTALENLVRLLGVSYFAGPVVPRDLTQESLKAKEQKAQNAKVKINQSKRKGKE